MMSLNLLGLILIEDCVSQQRIYIAKKLRPIRLRRTVGNNEGRGRLTVKKQVPSLKQREETKLFKKGKTSNYWAISETGYKQDP